MCFFSFAHNFNKSLHLSVSCSNPAHNGRYTATSDPMRWQEAKAKCASLGGSLVKWDDVAVKNDVYSYITTIGTDVWTALTNPTAASCSGIGCNDVFAWLVFCGIVVLARSPCTHLQAIHFFLKLLAPNAICVYYAPYLQASYMQ